MGTKVSITVRRKRSLESRLRSIVGEKALTVLGPGYYSQQLRSNPGQLHYGNKHVEATATEATYTEALCAIFIRLCAIEREAGGKE